MITTNVIVSLTLLQLIIYAACGFDKGGTACRAKLRERISVHRGMSKTTAVVRLLSTTPARAAPSHATRPGKPAQPIARATTRYAICRRAAQPSGDSCARPKHRPTQSPAGRD